MTNPISQALQDAVSQLERAFPGVDVESHGGRFGLEDLKRLAVKTPAIRLSLLAIPPGERQKDGSIEVNVQWAAFILTGDKKGRARHVEALDLVGQLYEWLPYKSWAGCKNLDPSTLDARNLYGADVDTKTACAIWAITWRQAITLKGANR